MSSEKTKPEQPSICCCAKGNFTHHCSFCYLAFHLPTSKNHLYVCSASPHFVHPEYSYKLVDLQPQPTIRIWDMENGHWQRSKWNNSQWLCVKLQPQNMEDQLWGTCNKIFHSEKQWEISKVVYGQISWIFQPNFTSANNWEGQTAMQGDSLQCFWGADKGFSKHSSHYLRKSVFQFHTPHNYYKKIKALKM